MNGAHEFLTALATVLCVAGVMSVVSRWLKQPAVLGYVLAGLLVGPHVPIPLVADRAIVQTLSELGVILLMFSLGLEFRVRRLAQLAPTAGLTAERLKVGGETITRFDSPGNPRETGLIYIDENGQGRDLF